ncbi:MAG: hypothetical protein ACRECT_07745 [Thermoplasmata archaeon]
MRRSRDRPPPRRRTNDPDPEAVADRRNRSIEEPLDVRLRSREPYPLLEVRNPVHGTGYLVMLPEFPDRASALCTCTDFARRGLGTCKHIEAGLRWVGDHPDATPLRARREEGSRSAVVWKKVDQRLAGLVRDATPAARRWRRPGAALYESEPTG